MRPTARPKHQSHDPESGLVRAAVPFRNDAVLDPAAFEVPTVAPPSPHDRATDRPAEASTAGVLDAECLRAPRVPAFMLDELTAPSSEPAETRRSAPTDRPAPEVLRGDGGDEAILRALGGPDAVPRPTVSGAGLRALALDHREGFLLSRIDGRTSLDEILDVAGVERGEALDLLLALREKGAIALSLAPRRPRSSLRTRRRVDEAVVYERPCRACS